MCENIAISKEHVPPKCLFPEPKDIGGLDFKKNLITVPSCEIHNMSKSQNDEFLMFSLAGIINNNKVGKHHFYTKVNRAIRRKEKDFLNKQILRNLRYVTIKTLDDKFTVAAIGHPNYERLEECFKSISYGLFFEQFKNTFTGEIRMILGFIDYKEDNRQTLKVFIKRRFELEKELLENIKGDNPKVFYYQFCKPDEYGLIALRMVFYEQNEVFVSFKPSESSIPFNLAFELMKSGTQTTFTLDDEAFTFNQDYS
jgi:hypothetical protein